MPLRMLMRYLLNNEQLVQKLAESYPMRRAAQLSAFMFHKGKAIGEDALGKAKESDLQKRLRQEANVLNNRAKSFGNTFTKEMKDGLDKMNQDMKRSQKK